MTTSRRTIGCLLVGAALAGLVALLGVLGLVVFLRTGDSPPPVPADWVAPQALPRAAQPLATERLAFDSDRTGNFEVFTMALDGSAAEALTADDRFDAWWPRLSPDRRTILFYRTPKGAHDRDFSVTSLWVMGSDGSGAVELRPVGLDGWTFQGHAEWSPDGLSLVMFGGSRFNPQIHVTDNLGRNPRAVTNRPGTNIDPAFSPDGREIVFVGCPAAVCREPEYEIYRIPTAGGDAVRLTEDSQRDHDPYFSPDGTKVAWLTQFSGGLPGVWDVQVADADGSNARRLAGDDGVTSKPQYSPDGSTIYVHRIPPGGGVFGIYAYPAAGGDPVHLTAGHPGVNEYPSL